MANDITGNPWYIDTAAEVFKQRVYVKNIIWNKPTAGTALIILDNQGRTIINTVANANDPMFDFGYIGWIEGFNVATLASGALTVVISK
jgi:hypothetical protein